MVLIRFFVNKDTNGTNDEKGPAASSAFQMVRVIYAALVRWVPIVALSLAGTDDRRIAITYYFEASYRY